MTNKLAQIGALAEAYFRTYPVATLTKLRADEQANAVPALLFRGERGVSRCLRH